MKFYRFTITFDTDIDDLDAVDAFYKKVDDASIATSAGVTFIHFDREANSLDDALHRAATEVSNEGWQIRGISVEPECVLPLTSP